MDFFKLAVNKAPIPAIAGFLVYVIFGRIIDKTASNYVLLMIAILTFLIVFLLLFVPVFVKEKFSKKSNIEKNTLSDIEVNKGDAFIGEKGTSSSEGLQIKENEINNLKVKKGDVFIGRKVDK